MLALAEELGATWQRLGGDPTRAHALSRGTRCGCVCSCYKVVKVNMYLIIRDVIIEKYG